MLSEFKPNDLTEFAANSINYWAKGFSKSRLRLPSTISKDTPIKHTSVIKSQSEGDLLKDFTAGKSKIPRSTSKLNPMQREHVRLNPKPSKGSYSLNKIVKSSVKMPKKGEKSTSAIGAVGELKVGNALEELQREKMEFEARKRKIASTDRCSKRINIILKTPREDKTKMKAQGQTHSLADIFVYDNETVNNSSYESSNVSEVISYDMSANSKNLDHERAAEDFNKVAVTLPINGCDSLKLQVDNDLNNKNDTLPTKIIEGKYSLDNDICDEDAIYASLNEIIKLNQEEIDANNIVMNSYGQKSKSTLTLDRDCTFEEEQTSMLGLQESVQLNNERPHSTIDLSCESVYDGPSDSNKYSTDVPHDSFMNFKNKRAHHLSTVSLSILPSSHSYSMLVSKCSTQFSQTFSPSFGHKFASRFGSRFAVSKCPSVSSSTGVSWTREMAYHSSYTPTDFEQTRPASEDGSTPTTRKRGKK